MTISDNIKNTLKCYSSRGGGGGMGDLGRLYGGITSYLGHFVFPWGRHTIFHLLLMDGTRSQCRKKSHNVRLVHCGLGDLGGALLNCGVVMVEVPRRSLPAQADSVTQYLAF